MRPTMQNWQKGSLRVYEITEDSNDGGELELQLEVSGLLYDKDPDIW